MQCVKVLPFLLLGLFSLLVLADDGQPPDIRDSDSMDISPGMIEIIPITVSTGNTAKWGPEPYFRWTVKIQMAGGQWENHDFSISSDALFQLLEGENIQLLRVSERIFQAGAIEALWKSGHIGLGFEGVTWGTDVDQQYSRLFRTGVYAIVNLIRNEAIRLDIHSGYQFETKHINLSDGDSVSTFPQEIMMHWRTRFFAGRLHAKAAFNSEGPVNFRTIRASTGTQSHLRVLSIKDLRLGIGLDFKAEHDPIRENWGLNPNSVTASIYLDISYIHAFDGKNYGMRITR